MGPLSLFAKMNEITENSSSKQISEEMLRIAKSISKAQSRLNLLECYLFRAKLREESTSLKRKREDDLLGPSTSKSPKWIIANTDGSCIDNGTPKAKAGFGVVLSDGTKFKGPVSGKQTNNRAELTAVLFALKNLADERAVRIRTDSTYVKNGFTQWLNQWKGRGWRKANGKEPINRDLWEEADQLITARKDNGRLIEFEWVRGHSGDPGNEMADSLANQAALGPEK